MNTLDLDFNKIAERRAESKDQGSKYLPPWTDQ